MHQLCRAGMDQNSPSFRTVKEQGDIMNTLLAIATILGLCVVAAKYHVHILVVIWGGLGALIVLVIAAWLWTIPAVQVLVGAAVAGVMITATLLNFKEFLRAVVGIVVLFIAFAVTCQVLVFTLHWPDWSPAAIFGLVGLVLLVVLSPRKQPA